jgi:hypothetical protein
LDNHHALTYSAISWGVTIVEKMADAMKIEEVSYDPESKSFEVIKTGCTPKYLQIKDILDSQRKVVYRLLELLEKMKLSKTDKKLKELRRRAYRHWRQENIDKYWKIPLRIQNLITSWEYNPSRDLFMVTRVSGAVEGLNFLTYSSNNECTAPSLLKIILYASYSSLCGV